MEPVVSTDNCRFIITWRIESFSRCAQQKAEVLKSPLFIVDSLEKTTWRIYVYPRGNIDGKYVEIYLCREDSGPKKTTIIYELSFLTVDNYPYMTGKFQESDVSKSKKLGLANYPTTEEVFDTMRSIFLPYDTLTVRCRLWEPNCTGEDLVYCSASTRIGVERKFFIWHITDFSSLQIGEKIVENISSPWDFYDAITLELHLTGTSMQKAAINVRIIREKFNAKKLASYKLSLLDYVGNTVMCKECENWENDLEPKVSQKYFSKFLYRQELVDKEDEYLPEDVLSLHFEFSFTYVIEIEASESSNYLPDTVTNESKINCVTVASKAPSRKAEPHFLSLQDDLLGLYKEPTFSDFKLHTTERVFPVHKMVLSARVLFFKALFADNTRETTDTLYVSDVNADILDKMLLFVYTGRIQALEWESAIKLYYAADKFQIPSLKQTCSSFLKSNLTVSNVCEILMLLGKNNDKEFELATHDFIMEHDNEIMLSKEWVEFLHNEAEFAAQTMHVLYMKKLNITPSELNISMYACEASTQTSFMS